MLYPTELRARADLRYTRLALPASWVEFELNSAGQRAGLSARRRLGDGRMRGGYSAAPWPACATRRTPERSEGQRRPQLASWRMCAGCSARCTRRVAQRPFSHPAGLLRALNWPGEELVRLLERASKHRLPRVVGKAPAACVPIGSASNGRRAVGDHRRNPGQGGRHRLVSEFLDLLLMSSLLESKMWAVDASPGRTRRRRSPHLLVRVVASPRRGKGHGEV